jgi:hypothetical protein
MKKKIFEQTTPTSDESIDLKKLRDEYKCPFLQGGSLNNIKIVESTNNKEEELYNGQVIVRVADKVSPTGVYNAGDYLIITNEAEGENWVFYVVPAANWNKQYRRNENKIILQTYDNEGTWKCDNYTKATKGVRQTLTAQQEKDIANFIKSNAGWKDIGGIIPETEKEMYDIQDMKELYPNSFPTSYLLVKNFRTIEDDELIGNLNELIQSRNFSDKKTCKEIIANYFGLSVNQTKISDPTLLNFKEGVNYCRKKFNDNFNDLGVTKKRIDTLLSIEGRYNLTTKVSKFTTTTTTIPQ